LDNKLTTPSNPGFLNTNKSLQSFFFIPQRFLCLSCSSAPGCERSAPYLLELDVQLLALRSHLQELPHDVLLLLPGLLQVGRQLGDDGVPLLQRRLKVLKLGDRGGGGGGGRRRGRGKSVKLPADKYRHCSSSWAVGGQGGYLVYPLGAEGGAYLLQLPAQLLHHQALGGQLLLHAVHPGLLDQLLQVLHVLLGGGQFTVSYIRYLHFGLI